jgi:hypothetical protein
LELADFGAKLSPDSSPVAFDSLVSLPAGLLLDATYFDSAWFAPDFGFVGTAQFLGLYLRPIYRHPLAPEKRAATV